MIKNYLKKKIEDLCGYRVTNIRKPQAHIFVGDVDFNNSEIYLEETVNKIFDFHRKIPLFTVEMS